MSEGVMVDGHTMTREDYETLLDMARTAATYEGFCPLCRGNSYGTVRVEHADECVLYRKADR